MFYIMITHWPGHFDNLRDNRTVYGTTLFRQGMNSEMLMKNTKTIFIKKDQNGTVEKCWLGLVSDFQQYSKDNRDYVSFSVQLQEQIDCPPKYANYSNGWYCEDEQPSLPAKDNLEPGFFEILKITTDWKFFEDNTYYLLKVLGVHNLYKFARDNQRGRSDGFFIFKNLVVMFDMTLERNYQETKKEQINNFCDQLRRGEINYYMQIYRTGERVKQVWIITKNTHSTLIKRIEDVSIKEISINDLINLYRKRLKDNMDEDTFGSALKNI